MIDVVLGAKGSVGTSIFAIALAKVRGEEGSTLLIDGDWGRRTLDGLLDTHPVYDIYDILRGSHKDLLELQGFSYASASLSHPFITWDWERLGDLQKERIVIDGSRLRVEELDGLPLQEVQVFLLTSDAPRALSLAESEMWKLKRRRVKVHLIINRVVDAEESLQELSQCEGLGRAHLLPEVTVVDEKGRFIFPNPMEEEIKRILEETKGDWTDPVISKKNPRRLGLRHWFGGKHDG